MTPKTFEQWTFEQWQATRERRDDISDLTGGEAIAEAEGKS